MVVFREAINLIFKFPWTASIFDMPECWAKTILKIVFTFWSAFCSWASFSRALMKNCSLNSLMPVDWSYSLISKWKNHGYFMLSKECVKNHFDHAASILKLRFCCPDFELFYFFLSIWNVVKILICFCFRVK